MLQLVKGHPQIQIIGAGIVVNQVIDLMPAPSHEIKLKSTLSVSSFGPNGVVNAMELVVLANHRLKRLLKTLRPPIPLLRRRRRRRRGQRSQRQIKLFQLVTVRSHDHKQLLLKLPVLSPLLEISIACMIRTRCSRFFMSSCDSLASAWRSCSISYSISRTRPSFLFWCMMHPSFPSGSLLWDSIFCSYGSPYP